MTERTAIFARGPYKSQADADAARLDMLPAWNAETCTVEVDTLDGTEDWYAFVLPI